MAPTECRPGNGFDLPPPKPPKTPKPLPLCRLPPDPTQPGLAAALDAAQTMLHGGMHYECDSIRCEQQRTENVDRLLHAFDSAAAATSIPSARQAPTVGNRSVIGFLTYASWPSGAKGKFYETCYPLRSRDRPTPWWLRAIRTRPDFLREGERLCNKIGLIPHNIIVAAYLAFARQMEVRIVRCDEYSCLDDTEDLSALIVKMVPGDLTLRIATRGQELRDVYYALLRRLEARGVRIYPKLEQQRIEYTKRRFYDLLTRAGVAVAPYIAWVDPTPAATAAAAALRTGWLALITKPAFHHEAVCGYGSSGITHIPLREPDGSTPRSVGAVAAELTEVAEACDSIGHIDMTLQRFEPSVSRNFEMRTYFYGGLYSHSVGTLSAEEHVLAAGFSLRFDVDTFEDESLYVPWAGIGRYKGNLTMGLQRKIVDLGRRAVRAMPFDALEQPMVRVDAACCLGGKGGEWFVNEMGSYPDMLVDVDGEAIRNMERLAEAYRAYALRA